MKHELDLEAAVDWTDELRAQHGKLSSTHLQFLDFLGRYPGGLDTSHFAPVHVRDEFTRYAVQSWPLFLGASRRQQFEEAACAVSRLIRCIPERFFDNDPARLREFYNLSQDQAVLISTMIGQGALKGPTTRCDFLDTEQGFQCVELNAGNLSGWQTAKYLERYARIPAFQDFMETLPGEVFYRSPARALFAHYLEECRELATEGELNICFAVDSDAFFGQWVAFLSGEYAAVLAASGNGLKGSLFASKLSSLQTTKGALWAGSRRVHIVHEPSFGRLTRPLLIAVLAKKVRLYNGPVCHVLTDKGNLALVSEAVGSDLLSAEEEAAVKAWIPWTRRVVAGTAAYRGEEVYLPEWLLAERQRLVLKARVSLGGKEVHVGRFTSPEDWKVFVEQALRDEYWVVQEYVVAPPYQFLAESGCVAHDLVWGLFTFGDRYGGNFFRVQEQKPSALGIVNATQGASFGLVLEVETGNQRTPEYLEVPRSQQAPELRTAEETTALPAARPGAEVLRAQQSGTQSEGFLSRAHEQFAEYVSSQPEELLHSSYSTLETSNDSTQTPVQPWPVFLPRSKAEVFASVAGDLARLFLDLPGRVFQNVPSRYEEFYQLGEYPARLVGTLIDTTGILANAIAHSEFIETADGLKCLEFNVCGGLEGWSVGAWQERYLADPLIAGFRRRTGLGMQPEMPSQAVFRHILEEVGALAEEGEVNIAFAVPRQEQLTGTGCWPEDYEREYQAVLASYPDLVGSIFPCWVDNLRWEEKILRLGDRRMHAVVEVCHGVLTEPIVAALQAGTVRVYNGPVSRVLGDQLNLALLSELADSDLFSTAEQEILRAHIPWTRRASAEFVNFLGERAYLPDLLSSAREKMVLKEGYSALGGEVFVGADMSQQAWEELVERVLGTPGWVAQEFVEGTTYLFKSGADPQAAPQPHDLIWRFLTHGPQYGGCFVRLMERGEERVVNRARGASLGVILEVDEGPA